MRPPRWPGPLSNFAAVADPIAPDPITGQVQILPITGLPEFRPGDDLAGLLCDAAPWMRDGDILVVTSKAVSKVEGRLVGAPSDPAGRQRARMAAIEAETARVVAHRGDTRIVVTHHGWVMAAAGVDASNVAAGELALLPLDADASARRLRQAISDRAGILLAVVISDTNGRTWRRGLTDVAIGVAGMAAVTDLRGQPDASGVPLEITEIAVADEVAAAADLVKGKLSGVPAAILRGLEVPGDDGLGSATLRRPIAEDMFPLGTRDVVPSWRPATAFGRGAVPDAVVRSAIEIAVRASGLSDSLELLPANPFGPVTDAEELPAERLLRQATAVIVPIRSEATEGEAGTRLGMAIAALLIQLHAEGLAATWLPPSQLDALGNAGLDTVRGPAGDRSHGVVVVGQIDR